MYDLSYLTHTWTRMKKMRKRKRKRKRRRRKRSKIDMPTRERRLRRTAAGGYSDVGRRMKNEMLMLKMGMTMLRMMM